MVIGMVIFLACLVSFTGTSALYVYRYRGATRYDGFGEYLRKGWPMFAPLNCLLYLTTRKYARQAIIDQSHIADLQVLKDHWMTIRDEALALHQAGHIAATTDPTKNAYFDIGFRTFFKYGWSKFYLKWYGYAHKSARELCPKTVEILCSLRSINGAMFSVLPPGSKLTRHLDPVACSLRFHLGLSTPNSDDCFINVDGQVYSWRDGEALLFDETYLHFARNDTSQPRIILMCDVERPMNLLGRMVNACNRIALRMSVVPNMEGDRRGLANTIFSTLSPLLARTKALKQSNRALYLVIKHTVNLTLVLLALAILGGLFYLIAGLIDRLTA